MMAADDPTRYYLPTHLAPNGWVGLRLDVGEIDWNQVAASLGDCYRRIAPKRLATLVTPLA
jgi:phosphoribosylglycinamide formyltransferase 1